MNLSLTFVEYSCSKVNYLELTLKKKYTSRIGNIPCEELTKKKKMFKHTPSQREGKQIRKERNLREEGERETYIKA